MIEKKEIQTEDYKFPRRRKFPERLIERLEIRHETISIFDDLKDGEEIGFGANEKLNI